MTVFQYSVVFLMPCTVAMVWWLIEEMRGQVRWSKIIVPIAAVWMGLGWCDNSDTQVWLNILGIKQAFTTGLLFMIATNRRVVKEYVPMGEVIEPKSTQLAVVDRVIEAEIVRN